MLSPKHFFSTAFENAQVLLSFPQKIPQGKRKNFKNFQIDKLSTLPLFKKLLKEKYSVHIL